MNKILKNVFLSIGTLAFVFALVGFVSTNTAYAATCTAEATGLWSAASTWDAACNDSTIPDADDTVVIPGNFVVTVDAAGAVAGTVSISNPVATGNNGITIASPGTLVVAGTVTIVGSSGASHSTIAVADGALTAAGIAIAGGGSSGNSIVSASTGTITTTSGVTFSGTAGTAQLTTTGAGTINLTGTVSAGGTVAINAATSLVSTGTSALNGAYTWGIATVSSGTLTIGANSVFAGNVTVASGATLTNTSFTVGIAGNLANSGTFTAGTGVHTMSGTTKTITGTVAIPSLTVSGTVSNTNTLTVATALAGGGTLTNAAGATLNLGGTSTVTTLVANTTGNTVNYTGGAQTIKVPTPNDYYVLNLSGTDVKTIGAIDVLHRMSMASTLDPAVLSNGTAPTAYTLQIANLYKNAGTWGSTGSGATNKSDVFFAAANTGVLTVSHKPAFSSSTPITTTPATPADPSTTPTTPAEPATPGVACPAGHAYRASDGAKCTTTEASADAVFCPAGHLFRATDGKACTTSTPPGLAVAQSAGGNAYAFGVATVRTGTRGEACRAWQTFFNAKAGANLATDGVCGPLTMGAARAWQASAGLVADGLLGPASRAKANMQ